MNFFRKIRRKLAEDNKPKKYTRYAIGEIMLVVVGILVALQINNWNSNRKLNANNSMYLKRMLVELELNKSRMKMLAFEGTNIYPCMDEVVKNCDSLLKKSYRNLNVHDVKFVLNEKFDAGGSRLNLNNGVYEELINTGKLYTIGSDYLINSISNYYKRCEREEEYNIENTNSMINGFKIMERGFVKLRLDYRMDSINFDINNYSWYFDGSSHEYKNLQIGVSYILFGQRNNFNKMREIIHHSDLLINIIEQVLNTNVYQ